MCSFVVFASAAVVHGIIVILIKIDVLLVFYEHHVRGVFQKYAERFHRMIAIAARLVIFHYKHAWYMLIKYR